MLELHQMMDLAGAGMIDDEPDKHPNALMEGPIAPG